MIAGVLSSSDSSVLMVDARNYEVIKNGDKKELELSKQKFVSIKQREIKTWGDKYVVFPDSRFMQVFEVVRVICCCIEFITYPFSMNHGNDTFTATTIALIAISELVFVIDIVLKFFLAVKKKGFDIIFITE